MVLGYGYNELGGADVSWITRNLFNAGGYVSFIVGSTEVFSGT